MRIATVSIAKLGDASLVQFDRGPTGARRCNRGPIGAGRCNRAPIVPWCNPSHPYYSSTPVFLSMRIATMSVAKLGDASLVQFDRGLTAQSGPDQGPTVQSGLGARRCNRGPIGARRCNRAPIVPRHPYYSSTPVFLSMRIATVSIAKLGDASLAQLTGPTESGPDRGAMAQSGAIGPKRCNRAGPNPGEPRKPFSRNFRLAQRETLLEPFLRAAP